MPVVSKFPVLAERTVLSLPAFSESARATAFASLAQKRIAAVDDGNAFAAGRRLPHVILVDGAADPRLSRVRSTSIIVARWSVGFAAVDFIWSTLQHAGPHRSGAYRASARMYVDGAESFDPQDAVGAREVLFMPTVPYARKIERGLKGYAPGRVYESVAQAAQARFGNAARIKFTYAEPEGPAPQLDAWARASAGRRRIRAGRADKGRRQPAILVILE